MPIRLLIIAISLVLAGAPLRAQEAAPDQGADQGDAWLNYYDYQEREAFQIYGPPLKEDAARFNAETQLYLDMIEHFYIVSEDEDDFDMVVEAFSVPVETFRPSSFRPDGIIDDSLFADDPLPQEHRSSSYYVDSVRPSYMPGGAFKPRSVEDVKLGDSAGPRSLFLEEQRAAERRQIEEEKRKADEERKKAEAADAEKKKADAKAAEEKEKEMAAGQINKPKKPEDFIPNSDAETLAALREAIRDLGLQKQLNFEPNSRRRQTLVQMGGENNAAKTEAGAETDSPAPAAAPPEAGKAPVPPAETKSVETKNTETKKQDAPAPETKEPAKAPAKNTARSPEKSAVKNPAKGAAKNPAKDSARKKKKTKAKKPDTKQPAGKEPSALPSAPSAPPAPAPEMPPAAPQAEPQAEPNEPSGASQWKIRKSF